MTVPPPHPQNCVDIFCCIANNFALFKQYLIIYNNRQFKGGIYWQIWA